MYKNFSRHLYKVKELIYKNRGHSKEAKGDHVNPVLKSGMCSYKHGICMIGEEGEWAIGQSIIFFNQNIQENFIHKSSFIIARKCYSTNYLITAMILHDSFFFSLPSPPPIQRISCLSMASRNAVVYLVYTIP